MTKSILRLCMFVAGILLSNSAVHGQSIGVRVQEADGRWYRIETGVRRMSDSALSVDFGNIGSVQLRFLLSDGRVVTAESQGFNTVVTDRGMTLTATGPATLRYSASPKVPGVLNRGERPEWQETVATFELELHRDGKGAFKVPAGPLLEDRKK